MNPFYKVIILYIILFSDLITFGQTKIHGKLVSDKKEIIPGANIYIKDSYDGASSKEDGTFSFITSEKGDKTIVVSCISFETFEQKITLNGNDFQFDPVMVTLVTELDMVSISVGTIEANDEKKAVMLKSLDIVTTAGSKGDIYGALQTLPGTQLVQENEGLFVRGGAAYETKTIMDNMIIQNPYYSSLPDIAQRGRFSPFMFKGTAFNTGGYSAQYGQALSSVLILNTRDMPARTTSDIGLMSVGGSVGHTHLWKNSSFGVNVSYINLKPNYSIFNQQPDWVHPPEAKEINLSYRLKTSPTGILKFYSNTSLTSSSLYYNDLDSAKQDLFSLKNQQHYINTSYTEALNDKWLFFSGLAYNNNRDRISIESDKILRLDVTSHGRIGMTRLFGKYSSFKFGSDMYEKGGLITFNKYNNSLRDFYSSVFAETDYYFSPKFVIRYGLRFENASIIDKTNLANRTSVSYKTGKKSQFSFAYGEFYQTPEYEFLYSYKKLDFEKAQHYILNFQFLDESARTFRIEAYYKDYTQLVKGDQSFYSWKNLNNNGKGYAKGFDIFWRDKTLPRIDYWISYSYLDTKRNYRDFPQEAVPHFASKHTFSNVFKQYIPKITTSVGFTYSYSTGRTFYNPNNPVFNGEKLKDYHNLSFNASYLTSIFDHFTVVFVGVENILGVKHIYGYRYSSDGTIKEEIKPTSLRPFFIGMFMSIGEDRVKN